VKNSFDTLAISDALARPVRTAIWLRIDSLDAALLAQSRIPNLNRLRQQGAWGRCADDDGSTCGLIAPWPGDPMHGLFQSVRHAGGRTALVAGRRALRRGIAPDHLDFFVNPGPEPWAVAQEAVSLLRNDRPHVCGIQFGAPETAAYRHGWGSLPHREAIAECDAALGLLLHALRRAAPAGETLLVVTTRRHLVAAPGAGRSCLPWLCVGPGVPANRELDRPIADAETAALLAGAIDAPALEAWRGVGNELVLSATEGKGTDECPLSAVAPGGQQLQLALGG
jgi:hypothetical protein